MLFYSNIYCFFCELASATSPLPQTHLVEEITGGTPGIFNYDDGKCNSKSFYNLCIHVLYLFCI